MANANLKGKLTELLERVTGPLAVEIWNIEIVRQKDTSELRVFLDKEGGISLDDLEKASRQFEAELDGSEIMQDSYTLIVSSPGMDRSLLTDAHYGRYVGAPVEVSLFKQFEGRKKFPAVLGERTRTVTAFKPIDRDSLEKSGEELAVPNEMISKVNLMVVI
ncbi:MAG: ribosome maturation factor RimP [Clostridiales Family XIII bacterium]|jgi:ribosome maturation factor RimP|nr:ribosome maturation factor RimP [Clostridiales Family XIII bacterium]